MYQFVNGSLFMFVRIECPTSSVFLFHKLFFEKYHRFNPCTYVVCVQSWTCNFAGCVLQSVNHIIICSTSSLHVVYPRINALHVSLISIQNSPIFVWENVCCRYYSVSICPGNCENVCMTRIKSNNTRSALRASYSHPGWRNNYHHVFHTCQGVHLLH